MEKLSMRKIREVPRLSFELDLSERQISKGTDAGGAVVCVSFKLIRPIKRSEHCR